MRISKYGHKIPLCDELIDELAEGLGVEEDMPGVEAFLKSKDCTKMLDKFIEVIRQHIEEHWDIDKILE